jgi:hypothetical protein
MRVFYFQRRDGTWHHYASSMQTDAIVAAEVIWSAAIWIVPGTADNEFDTEQRENAVPLASGNDRE